MKKTTYYIVRAKDCFGDLWPLGTESVGIDGTHESFEGAKASAERFERDANFRREMRKINGWEKNTIRGLEIHEVVMGDRID